MRKLRVAILGQGRSGRDIHGAFFASEKAKEKFELVLIVDPLSERREKAQQEYGCEVFSDYKQIFGRNDIDLVINSTPSNLHPSITKDLMEHGFNVISEKPLARKVSDVDMLIETSKKTGKFFNIFQQSRLTPYFLKIKEILNSGVLGEVFEIDICFNGFSRRWDWQTLQKYNGGNLLNTGPHPLDQALNLLDMYDGMPNVFCKMGRANTFGDAEDYVKLILTAPGRPLIDLSISSCDAYSSFTYKIHAKYGGLLATTNDISWKYYKPEEAPIQNLTEKPLVNDKGNPSYCSEKLIWHEEKWNIQDSGAFTGAVHSYYDMIYAYLTENKPLDITPMQVRQQIAVIEECHRQNPLARLEV